MSTFSFLMGFVTGVLTILVWGMQRVQQQDKQNKEEKPVARWTKIEAASFQWNFDWNIPDRVKMKYVLDSLPELMQKQLEKPPMVETGAIEIVPGQYSVELRVHAKFTGREEPPASEV